MKLQVILEKDDNDGKYYTSTQTFKDLVNTLSTVELYKIMVDLENRANSNPKWSLFEQYKLTIEVSIDVDYTYIKKSSGVSRCVNIYIEKILDHDTKVELYSR